MCIRDSLRGVGIAQDVQRRVDEYRMTHPTATWKEIFANVPCHYNNYKNLYASLRSNAERLAMRARQRQKQQAMFQTEFKAVSEAHATRSCASDARPD